MDKLPQELVDNIVRFLPITLDAPSNGDANDREWVRPKIAALSATWQRAIERFTFSSLHIKSNDMHTLSSLFSQRSNNRHLWLMKLQYDIVLPSYSDEACALHETQDDRAVNDAVAGHYMSGLLQFLSKWPHDGNVSLTFGIYSLMDGSRRGKKKWRQDQHDAEVGRRKDIFDDRYRYSYISLSGARLLPVPCVTSFQWSCHSRVLDPSSLVTLTSMFPRLESACWDYEDPEFFLALRQQHLRGFAEAVISLPLSSTLSELYIEIISPHYTETKRLPNMAGDGSLTEALRIMVSRSKLQKLNYEGPLDPSFFWPDGAKDDIPWPYLRELNIQFDLASLSGKWLFKGLPSDDLYDRSQDVPLPFEQSGLFPPGYGNDMNARAAVSFRESMAVPIESGGFVAEGYDFRCVPNDDAMNPLLEAFAHRLMQTPSMQFADMRIRLDRPSTYWFISYSAPGEATGDEGYCRDPEPDPSRARICIHPDNWRPDETVMRLLRGIGKACHGQESIINLIPNQFWGGG